MNWNDELLSRYSRHILLKEVGIEGQQKILDAKVLIIGAGGLGSPAALYLAAAGVGTIGIADFDTVDLTNLQRQIIHFTADVGSPKARSARDKILAINPHVRVVTIEERLCAENIRNHVREYDLVIDGTDNFSAKYLINDACVLEKKTFSHGGILRFNGQTMTVKPGETACYRCVFRTPPPAGSVATCSQAGVLGAIAGMLGTIQAAEILKVILGIGRPLYDNLLTFHSLEMDFRKVKIRRAQDCPVCGDQPTVLELSDGPEAVCDIRKKE